MASNDEELKTEVENFIEDTVATLSSDAFDQAFANAKRHIAVRKGVDIDTFDFYDTSSREDAMFWWTCVFSKVATGELDTGDIQVGAVDIEGLLANESGEVVTWLRNALTALRAIDSGGDNAFGFGITAPTRDNRVYGGDDTGGTDTGLSADEL